jgi:16S rRNA (guanine966-N2)-methyltransferase
MSKGLVRIIGGQWRGRKLKVADEKELRPTPDRVRETLFNWLAPVIKDAVCLDLFAGSGVLGFEALSRGAKFVVMIDQSKIITKLLNEELTQFAAKNAVVYQAKLPEGLPLNTHSFDIVFIDPPYQSQLLIPCCFFLEEQGLLAEKSYIYLESAHTITDDDLPEHWHIIKNKKAGQVFYHLVKREK